MFDKNAYRQNRANLEAVLTEAGATIRGKVVKCPFHDDRNPSGGIFQSDDGAWRFRCQTCDAAGDVFDVIAKTKNCSVGDVLRELSGDGNTRPKPQQQQQTKKTPVPFKTLCEYWQKHIGGKIETVWSHSDYQGRPWARTIRIRKPDGGKEDRWLRPVDGTWEGNYLAEAPPKPWILYGGKSTIETDTVVIVEGQKCVDALRQYGFAAVTGLGGSKNAGGNDWTTLAGKNLIIWSDNDEAGERYASDVAAICGDLQPTPRIAFVNPGDAELTEPGEDVADFIEQSRIVCNTDEAIKTAIQSVLDKARPRGAASGLLQRIEAAISGELKTIDWPWHCIDRLTKSLMPGTVTILCGSPGASKSLMLLEAAAHWHSHNIRAIIRELEEEQDYHLARALAQRAGISGLTDPEFIAANPEMARQAYSEHEDYLNTLGNCIDATDGACPTLEQVAEWTEKKAKAGYRVIGVDPITIAARTGDPWKVDNAFMGAIGRTAKNHKCSIVLVSHPSKVFSGPDMTQLAGGAAFIRFAQSIIWLEAHSEKTNTVTTALGTISLEHNRTLHILKARNGRGQGLRVAMNFDGDTLRLREEGVIRAKQ